MYLSPDEKIIKKKKQEKEIYLKRYEEAKERYFADPTEKNRYALACNIDILNKIDYTIYKIQYK